MADPIRTTQSNDLNQVISAFTDATGSAVTPGILTGLIIGSTFGVLLVFSIYIIAAKAGEERNDIHNVIRPIVLAIITVTVLLAFIYLATV